MDEDGGAARTHSHYGWECKLGPSLGKIVFLVSTKLNIHLLGDPSTQPWVLVCRQEPAQNVHHSLMHRDPQMGPRVHQQEGEALQSRVNKLPISSTGWPGPHSGRIAFLKCPKTSTAKAACHLGHAPNGWNPKEKEEKMNSETRIGGCVRGGRGGTRWEGPLAGFELLAAFSFSAVCTEEVSSSAGMTQGSHTAKAPRWLSCFRAKSPAAPPATARLSPSSRFCALRSCRRACPRPGAFWGAAFPGPPPLGALGARHRRTLCEHCHGRSPAAPPTLAPALPARPAAFGGQPDWRPATSPPRDPGRHVPAAANAPQAGCRAAPPAGSAVLLTARVPIPPNRCGGRRPRVPTHIPA